MEGKTFVDIFEVNNTSFHCSLCCVKSSDLWNISKDATKPDP